LILFFQRENTLVKGLSELTFKDVSDDPWDKNNLTKTKLNYSLESIGLIDEYIIRIKETVLVEQYLNTLASRIGAYIGEIIRRNLKNDYNWYNFFTVERLIKSTEPLNDYIHIQQVIYSKKHKKSILPMYETYNFLTGNSRYLSLKNYVEEMIRSNI